MHNVGWKREWPLNNNQLLTRRQNSCERPLVDKSGCFGIKVPRCWQSQRLVRVRKNRATSHSMPEAWSARRRPLRLWHRALSTEQWTVNSEQWTVNSEQWTHIPFVIGALFTLSLSLLAALVFTSSAASDSYSDLWLAAASRERLQTV